MLRVLLRLVVPTIMTAVHRPPEIRSTVATISLATPWILLPFVIGALVLRWLLRRWLPGLLCLPLIQPDLLSGWILIEIRIPGTGVLPASIRMLLITHGFRPFSRFPIAL